MVKHVARQKEDWCRESFAVISPENRQWPNMPLPTAPEGWILPQKLSARRNNAMNCVYKQCLCVYSLYVSMQLSLVFGSLYKLSLVIVQFKEIARSSLKALTWHSDKHTFLGHSVWMGFFYRRLGWLFPVDSTPCVFSAYQTYWEK